MLFQTLPFLVFFAVVYPIYLLVKGTRLRLPWMLVISYAFYAWLGWTYLIPLAYVTIVDYLVTGRMVKSRRPRAWLALSIANDLGVLVFFKYAGFIADNINFLLRSLGVSYSHPAGGFPIARRPVLLPPAIHRLHNRCLSRPHATGEQLPGICDVRVVLPAPAGRADRESESPSAAVA